MPRLQTGPIGRSSGRVSPLALCTLLSLERPGGLYTSDYGARHQKAWTAVVRPQIWFNISNVWICERLPALLCGR